MSNTVTEQAREPLPGVQAAAPAARLRAARDDRALWVLAGILVIATLARFVGLTQGFPRDFHWDERIYFHEAFYALANGLRREQTVSANLPYLLLPGILLQWLVSVLAGQVRSFGDLVRAYIADPAPFLLVGRTIWAASGVLSVAMVYRLGRRLSGPPTGLLAAFFLAVAFLPVEEGHFIKNDGPAGLFLLLALDACFSIVDRDIAPRALSRAYWWAGFWVGVASATKYYCAAVVLVVLLAHWLRSRQGKIEKPAGKLGLAALAAIIGGVGTTPGLLVDPANVWYNISQELGAQLASVPTDGMPQWLFYISEHLGHGLGAPLLGLALLGFFIVLTRRTAQGLLLIATPVVFFIAINLRPNNFARYIIPAVPFLCITAALTLRTAVGTLLSPLLMRLRGMALEHPGPLVRRLTAGRVLRLLGPALLTIGAVVFAAPSWLDDIRYDRYALAPDTRNAAQAWFESAVPAGATVLIEGGESFERTSNLGPQLWPTAGQLLARGPNEERERFFWEQLVDVVRASPAYTLTLVGAFERTIAEVDGKRQTVPVTSTVQYGAPDYIVLINWRSADLRPGSTAPLWQSLTDAYTLVQTFACQPCFPDDYYAYQIDYPTLESIAPAGGPAPEGGPEVRVFQRKPAR